MSRSSNEVVPAQLHTLLPGPHGAHACLTLYDECPHTNYSIPSRPSDPYLHHNLPAPRHIRALTHASPTDKEVRFAALTTQSQPNPKENPPAARLAPLVLSRHSPVMHHIRESTRALPEQTHSLLTTTTTTTSLPTVHILTFATTHTPSPHSFNHLLSTHLPPQTPLLYSIDASRLLVPPQRLCEVYSGVSAPVQDAVLEDPRAREEIDRAVGQLVRFVTSPGSEGRRVGLAVGCTAGTHRSVAVGELVGGGVRESVRRVGMGRGVVVKIRHVHRVRGEGDVW